MRVTHVSIWLAAAAVLAGACGGDDQPADPDAAAPDAATDAAPDATNLMPTMLSETGLYSDLGSKTIAADVIEFAPRWQLWSDRATKRRWIWLPPGAKIDTSNMDHWSFPQGTKLWKEFTRDGVLIETRLLQKIGATDDVSDWYMVSFQWTAGMADAVAVPAGTVDDAGNNDIPSRSDCRKCHGPNRVPSVILGFSAMQLDHDLPAAQMDLARLVAEDRLTAAPTGGGAGGYFPLPTSAGADTTTAALGYLHANCSGCHNPRSDVVSQTMMNLRLETDVTKRTSWAVTPPYATTVDRATEIGGAGVRVEPGVDPAAGAMPSVLFNRMNTTGASKMPPTARETIDTDATAAVRAWILSLTPTP